MVLNWVLRIFQFSEYHVLVAEQVLQMIEVMKDNLPRLEIYEKLSYDIALQTALLNVYTDIVEYSLQIFRFIRRRSSSASRFLCLIRSCINASEFELASLSPHHSIGILASASNVLNDMQETSIARPTLSSTSGHRNFKPVRHPREFH